MKILFILPKEFNIYGDKKTKTRLPHIGIAYLSAYLKQDGHEVSFYDLIDEDESKFFTSVLYSYDVIGISLCSFKITHSYMFVNKVVDYLNTSTNKKIPVILGGPHVTVTGKESLIKTNADFAIKGEGELTLSELLKEINNKDSFSNINGLIWRDKVRGIIENDNRDFIKDINTLPFPDYSIFKFGKYMSSMLNEIPLLTSRGCPYDCIFCAIKLIAGKQFRGRSPDNVMKEIINHYNNSIRNFYISDDIFNLDIKRAEEICDLIIKNNLKIKFIFHNGIRADCLTYRLAEKLKQAGCTTIVISAESGDNSILQIIKKNTTVEKINASINILNTVKINFIVNFIIGHPTENYKKAMTSINLAKNISKNKYCATIMFFNTIPYPSTEIYEWVNKHAKWLFNKEEYLNNSMTSNLPIFESDDFTKEQKVSLLKKGNKIHNKTLLRFIFGRYIGYLIYIFTNIKFIKYLALKFSFNNKFGEEFIYKRFLKKLYNL